MNCPKCGAKTYLSRGGKQICSACGYGSAREQQLEQQKAERKAGLAAIGAQPDLVLPKEHGTLQIFYRNKGTRSEGQHGILFKDGSEVLPKAVDDILDTSLGFLRYYLHPEDIVNPWDLTGWNFVIESKIPWSWLASSTPKPPLRGQPR